MNAHATSLASHHLLELPQRANTLRPQASSFKPHNIALFHGLAKKGRKEGLG